MVADPFIGTAISIGFKALGGLFGKKSSQRKTTPLESAQRELIRQAGSPYQTSRIATPGAPRSATPAPKSSEKLYDYYVMVREAEIIIDKLNPEKGSRVGKLGEITDSDIRIRSA